jgi:hypothetical protein
VVLARRARSPDHGWSLNCHERRWVTTPTGLEVVDDDGMHILDREFGCH